MKNRPLTVAVFGDTHGHLRLMFQLARLWQLEHGEHLDLILQCGDLGYYPNTATIDKATRTYARRDPEELGFARFFTRTGLAEEDDLLSGTLQGPLDGLGTVRCPALWCHGNHEDFHTLAAMVGSRDLVAVDRFNTLRYLQSGRVVEVGFVNGPDGVPGLERLVRLTPEGAGKAMLLPTGADLLSGGSEEQVAYPLRLGTIGGGPERAGTPDSDWSTTEPLDEPLGWVGARSCSRLIAQSFDVLLCHCAPLGVGDRPTFGSPRLRTLVDVAQPSYCFYAHHREPVPASTFGRTGAHWLADVTFERNTGRGMYPFGRLEHGCMGLLRWDGPEAHRFEIVAEPWMDQVTWSSWRRL